jgi:hypothetical protein
MLKHSIFLLILQHLSGRGRQGQAVYRSDARLYSNRASNAELKLRTGMERATIMNCLWLWKSFQCYDKQPAPAGPCLLFPDHHDNKAVFDHHRPWLSKSLESSILMLYAYIL